MNYKGTFKNSLIFCHTTRKFFRMDDVRKQLKEHSMCLEEDQALLKQAMEEVQVQNEAVKRSMIIIVRINQEYGLFSYSDYEKSPFWNEMLRDLLPTLPDRPILYFVNP